MIATWFVFVVLTVIDAQAQPAPVSAEERAMCERALASDAAWRQALMQPAYDKLEDDTRERHAQDAAAIARNKRHVVMAYTALWLLTVGFLFYIWRRGRETEKLAVDLAARLEQALRK